MTLCQWCRSVTDSSVVDSELYQAAQSIPKKQLISMYLGVCAVRIHLLGLTVNGVMRDSGGRQSWNFCR